MVSAEIDKIGGVAMSKETVFKVIGNAYNRKDNSSSLGGMLLGGVATAVGGYFFSKILDKNKEKES